MVNYRVRLYGLLKEAVQQLDAIAPDEKRVADIMEASGAVLADTLSRRNAVAHWLSAQLNGIRVDVSRWYAFVTLPPQYRSPVSTVSVTLPVGVIRYLTFPPVLPAGTVLAIDRCPVDPENE
jgi:hypothetical protein